MTFQVGFPLIGADEHDLRSQFVADDGEKSPKGFDGSFATHPKKARDVEIDLINQSQVLVAFGILDLIDSDLSWGVGELAGISGSSLLAHGAALTGKANWFEGNWLRTGIS
jgi:hypothetical protein